MCPTRSKRLAIKADEGGVRRFYEFRVPQSHWPGLLWLFENREYLCKQHLGTRCK